MVHLTPVDSSSGSFTLMGGGGNTVDAEDLCVGKNAFLKTGKTQL